MSTHVWMLSSGEPAQAEDVNGYLRAQLQDPFILHAPGIFRALVVWWISWLWQRRMVSSYKQLPGPSPVEDNLNAQATLLSRHLGKGYSCHPVFRYRAPDAAQVAAGIGARDRVILLPMLPHRCGTVSSAVVDANTRLNARQIKVTSVPSYPDFIGYVDAVAETVRAAIADLPLELQTDYEVLFCAHLPPESRRGIPDDDHHAEVTRTVAAVTAAVGLVRPHHVGYTSSLVRVRDKDHATRDQLRDLAARQVPAAVLVPVDLTCDQVGTVVALDQDLGALAEESGTLLVRAETVATRPTFIRALAALVRQAERDAEWTS